MQHLVRLRWEELNSMEKRNFANVCIDLMTEITTPCEEWALKSQTAALVAEVCHFRNYEISIYHSWCNRRQYRDIGRSFIVLGFKSHYIIFMNPILKK